VQGETLAGLNKLGHNITTTVFIAKAKPLYLAPYLSTAWII